MLEGDAYPVDCGRNRKPCGASGRCVTAAFMTNMSLGKFARYYGMLIPYPAYHSGFISAAFISNSLRFNIITPYQYCTFSLKKKEKRI